MKTSKKTVAAAKTMTAERKAETMEIIAEARRLFPSASTKALVTLVPVSHKQDVAALLG